mmetsp:Transcript_107244/g.313606  ORF Transcript_107244/g.313606 Transcript_107244/m.313606 type:complete len:186 (+) Transcript_107244:165-722(+)
MPHNPFAAEPSEEPAPSATEWNKSAFPTVPMPAAPEPSSASEKGYGTMDAPPTTANGILSERISDSLASELMAAPVACILSFILQADDKSEEELLRFRKLQVSSILGGWIGCMIATLVAVLCGALAKWSFFQKRHVLVVVIVGLFGLSLVSFSQAVSHLSTLNPWLFEVTPTAVTGQLANATGSR